MIYLHRICILGKELPGLPRHIVIDRMDVDASTSSWFAQDYANTHTKWERRVHVFLKNILFVLEGLLLEIKSINHDIVWLIEEYQVNLKKKRLTYFLILDTRDINYIILSFK